MEIFAAGRDKPVSTPRGEDSSDSPVMRWPSLVDPTLSLPGRIDVSAAVAGLRHLDASAEPALVFSHLAAVCVPAVCDDIVVDLVENDHGYRIRQPAAASPPPKVPPATLSGSADGRPVLGPQTVVVAID